MSALTPDAARAAAEWLDARYAGAIDTTPLVGAGHLHAEADRLEAAAKTPGQVLAEHQGLSWLYVPPSFRVTYENRAAAVIAHHVGPDRVVVDRDDLVETLRWTVGASFASDINKAGTRLREALS